MTEEQSKIPSSLPDLHQPGKSVQRRMRAVSDTEKQELLMKLLEIWKSRPQLRLGQLLASPYLDASTLRDDHDNRCTCVGCYPIAGIYIHTPQLMAWKNGDKFEPCSCCMCSRLASQEDLLCDGCRSREGVSYLDTQRVEAYLAGMETGTMRRCGKMSFTPRL